MITFKSKLILISFMKLINTVGTQMSHVKSLFICLECAIKIFFDDFTCRTNAMIHLISIMLNKMSHKSLFKGFFGVLDPIL